MKNLLVPLCTLLLVTVDAHLRRLVPMPQFPGGSMPLDGAFWTGPLMFRGGMNNIQPWNNFGQWPQTWGPGSVWNNGISPVGNDRNIFNNNAMANRDPWEHYRKFNSGVKLLSGANQGQVSGVNGNLMPVSGVNPNMLPASQFTPGLVSNNLPWNSFATQQTSIPIVPNGLNQGFVSPQLQSNINRGFTNNNQFQNQGFPNTLPLSNGAFI